MKKSAAIIFLLSNFSCVYNPTGVAEAELNKEFDLKYGEVAVIGEEGLYVTLMDVVEDSRCPIGFNCFLPGNGSVLLKIEKKKNIPLIDTLNTADNPKALNYEDYKITLKALNPYPVADKKIEKVDYSIILLVEKETIN